MGLYTLVQKGGSVMVVFGTSCTNARRRAYDLLAMAVQTEWGLPQLPSIARRDGGKPYFPDHPELEFNLSHSGELILCALDLAPVGVDIQMVKAMRPGLPARVCSPQEQRWLEEQPDLWRGVAQLWAMKEAHVKYTGTGLTRSISSIPTPLLSSGQTHGTVEGLYVQIYSGEGWMGACCGTHAPPSQITWVTLP